MAQHQIKENSTDHAEAHRHVYDVVTKAGTSFFWAMRFLPKARRDAIFSVYAFCREVDDIADGELSLEDKRAALDAWRRDIAALYGPGEAAGLTARALEDNVAAYGLEREAFLTIIDGMEMDADAPIYGPSLAELKLYCARVASAVGLLCVRIFGENDEPGQRLADTLGLALQLTNILRDLEEDAERGRLYLPKELLDKHGVTGVDAAATLRHPNLPRVCREVATMAEEAFQAAEQAMQDCSKGANLRPAVIMMMVYRKTLDRLVAADWAYLAAGNGRQPGVSKAEKLFIALRYGVF